MARKYTTTNLINSIKTRVFIPSNQDVFTDANLLRLADEELQTTIVPMMMDVQEEYFVTSKTYALDGSTTSFTLPERAIGLKLKDVTILTSSGNERSLAQYSLEDSHEGRSPNATSYGQTDGFYLEGNKIKLMSTYSASETLKVYYFKRPNSLIDVDDAATITSFDTSARSVTVSALPSTFAVGEDADLVGARSPYDNKGTDLEISTVNGTTVTFTEDLPSDLRVGDYLCLAGEAPVVQVPTELFPVLSQLICVKVTEALGDQSGRNMAQAKLEEMSINAIQLISPRVEGERKIVTSKFNIVNYIARNDSWRY